MPSFQLTVAVCAQFAITIVCIAQSLWGQDVIDTWSIYCSVGHLRHTLWSSDSRPDHSEVAKRPQKGVGAKHDRN
jgi:hypothetical protein